MLNNNTDHNPFREHDQPQGVTPLTQTNLVPESPHVAFAARSPSIIPTPIYDDDSSIVSSPISSPALSSIGPPTIIGSNSPSPLSRQIKNDSPIASPTTSRNRDSAYDSKLEVGEGNNIYGPTFRDDENLLQQYNSSSTSVPSASSGFHQGDFVPLTEDQEEIQLDGSQSGPLFQQQYHPPPEQSRVDIFMSKLKGYQKPVDSSIAMELEEEEEMQRSLNNNTRGFKRHGNNDDDVVRHMPKQRGLLFRQLFGYARYPIFTWISAIIMVGVFVYEMIKNSQLSGSVIQTSPFNPMIGPNYMVSFQQR
jgi:hypothetical protein